MAENGAYDKALLHLQEELVKLRSSGLAMNSPSGWWWSSKGRDAAGKRGCHQADH